MKALAVATAFLCFAATAQGAVREQFVAYRHGETELTGYLAYDDAVKGKRPGVLVVHDWMGEGEFDRGVSRKLAALGYVAFAADIYGKGVRPRDTKEAAAQAGIYRADRTLMRARARAGLDVLTGHELVDGDRVAAMGYCFGGGVSLELARSGAPLKGVVSFHGNLDTPDPADGKRIRGSVLVLHGADDPYVPPQQVSAFVEEMQSAGLDWMMVSYGNSVHAFTNPAAGSDNSAGAAYNEKADRRSWEAMRTFFAEIFSRK
ncbi:MAG: dienelactone hydrolase family protein [bacterium]|nr:MAG: dienelactone hydrolase family protein [bacterium]